jgi:hypothetical protein
MIEGRRFPKLRGQLKNSLSIAKFLFCSFFALLLIAAVAGAEEPAAEKTLTGTKKIGEIEQPWKIRTLPTASFPEMPAVMRRELETRRCLIPQSYEAHRPENLVHGSFYALDKTDWATFCLADGWVSLLVFREGTAVPIELMHVTVADSVGPTGKPREPFGFYLAVDAVPPQRLRQLKRKNSSVLDSLETSIVDGNSVIHQWNGEAWIQFAGAQL